jgi:hypothetical protein
MFYSGKIFATLNPLWSKLVLYQVDSDQFPDKTVWEQSKCVEKGSLWYKGFTTNLTTERTP